MLESFGVFRCATCGRVDIDGQPIPEGASEAPAVVHTGSASFAAPPRGTTPITPTRPPLPRMLFAMIIIQAVLSTAAAFGQGGSLIRLVLRYTVLGGLLTGHQGAYRYALVGLTLGMFFGGIAVTSLWSQLPSMARLFVGLLFAIDVGFFVALLSPEARRHYEMQNKL